MKMVGQGTNGGTCFYGCCTMIPNHNAKDRKANKRAVKRAEKQALRDDRDGQ